MTAPLFDRALEKGARCERLSREEAFCLAESITVLLQGGHHPKVGLTDWQAYIEAIHETCPRVHIHPFSPAEIAFMAEKERCGVAEGRGPLGAGQFSSHSIGSRRHRCPIRNHPVATWPLKAACASFSNFSEHPR